MGLTLATLPPSPTGTFKPAHILEDSPAVRYLPQHSVTERSPSHIRLALLAPGSLRSNLDLLVEHSAPLAGSRVAQSQHFPQAKLTRHQHPALMGLVQNLVKRIPSSPSLPSLDDLSRRADKLSPRLAFFRRRIRLKGNSSISIPLGLVLLFPCIVIILILILFVRHPQSPGIILMPAGAPPSIRYGRQTRCSCPHI